MAQQLLHSTDICTSLQQVGRKTMAQCMHRHRFGNVGLRQGSLDRTLQTLFK